MKMRHPDIDGGAPPAEVTEEAFDEVWSEKGWVRVDEEDPATPLSPAAASAFEAARVAALQRGDS